MARRDAVIAAICLPGVAAGITVAALYGSAGPYFALAGALVLGPLLAYLVKRSATLSIDADETGVRIKNPYRTYAFTWGEVEKVEPSWQRGPYGSRIPAMLFRTSSGKEVKARAARRAAAQAEWDVEQIVRLAPGHLAIRSESAPGL